ncbi:MAG: transcriptional regulator [Flavobacteriaceae bacterium]
MNLKGLFLLCFFLTQAVANAQENDAGLQEMDSLISDLKETLELAETTNDSLEKVRAHIQLADFYKKMGIANEAIQHYYQALEIHKPKDTIFVYIENNIGAVNLSLKHYEISKEHLNKSLQTAEKINFDKGRAISYMLLGSVAEKKSNYDLALEYQERSLVIFKQLQDSTDLAITYENIGSIYEDLGDLAKAHNYFSIAHEYSKNSPSNIQINIINNLGDANRKSGNLEKSLELTQQALRMSRETHNGHQEASALKDLAQVYADMGAYKLSYEYMNEHDKVKELEVERRNTELVSTLQILYNIKEKEAEVKLLNQKNEINRIRQNGLLLGSVFVVLVLAGWIFYYKKKKQQESKLYSYEQELLKADLERKTAEESALQREIGIKLSALTNYSLHLAHKNKMLSDISHTLFNLKDRNVSMIKPKLESLVKEIDFDLAKEQEWTEFIGFFEQIHPNFFENLKSSASSELSPAELRLCMLLRLNLSSKEIASILRITPDSVRIARYRLRKKLTINTKDDLQTFILNL